MDVSIVIPVFNEVKSIPYLYKEIKSALAFVTNSYEIVFIDDGSSDGSYEEMIALHTKDPRVVVIRFRKNFGQTAALKAGFIHAKGEIIVSLDADLQDNPAEIPRLIGKLSKGYDVICAWRFNRQDSLSKKILSKGANCLRKALTRDKIHDSGCTFRAYKKEVVQDLELYGELHRAIPTLLRQKGFRIGEVKVKHRKRKYGTTKYSMKRVVKGFLDLLMVKFWMDYAARPIHLFGSIGIIAGLLGFLLGIVVTVEKYLLGTSADRPLLLLAILLILLGFQSLMFGTLADIGVKTYFKNKEVFYIKNIEEKKKIASSEKFVDSVRKAD